MSARYQVIYFLAQAVLMPTGKVCSVIACEPLLDADYRPEPDSPIIVASFHGGDLCVPATCERTHKIVSDRENPAAFEELVKGYEKASNFIDLREFSPLDALLEAAEKKLVDGVTDAATVDSSTQD